MRKAVSFLKDRCVRQLYWSQRYLLPVIWAIQVAWTKCAECAEKEETQAKFRSEYLTGGDSIRNRVILERDLTNRL
jgi:hypothetical protein